MPEIKHTFQGARMNKDLDERLVPNGEYRDALNVQVRTSSGIGGGDTSGAGDIGAVQNIKSPRSTGFAYHNYRVEPEFGAPIAMISDDKNNCFYTFFAGVFPSQFDEFTYGSDGGNNFDDNPGRGLFFRDTIYKDDGELDNSSRALVVVDYFGALQSWIQVCGGFQYGDVEITNDDGTTTTQPGVTLPQTTFNQIQVTDANYYRVGMEVTAYASANTSGKGEYIGELFRAKIKSLDTTSSPNTITFYNSINPNLFQTEINGQSIQGVAGFKFLHPDRPLNFKKPSSTEITTGGSGYGVQFNYTDSDRYTHITGINIIDNLLFWTDNNGEPKKINIDRCIAGTPQNASSELHVPIKHTQLVVEQNNTFVPVLAEGNSNNLEASTSPKNNDLREEHVTVLRQAPKTAPTLEMSRTNRVGDTDIFVGAFSFTKTIDNGSYTISVPVEIGDELIIGDGGVDITFAGTDFYVDDIITFTSVEEEILNEVSVKVKFLGYVDSNNDDINSPDVSIKVQILSVDNQLTEATLDWNAELELSKPLFEHKFVRFGYRYKYEDGEYSAFSPWSELAFLPDEFEYSPRKGFNLGMSNQLRYLCVKDFLPLNSDRPLDVTGVDILFKTTDSPTVYIVKTIERKIDPEWEYFTPGVNNSELQTGKLVITSEMIHRIVPANQLLRSWDNVPRKALAQEIVGNRVVYGNYVQGYNLDFTLGLQTNIASLQTPTIADPKKSIKSLRSYKIGLVLGDKYGRETPVIESGSIMGNDASTWNVTTSDLVTEKQLSITENKLNISQDWSFSSQNIPDWIYYFKYYIKETSNEYYNLVMDRWYDASDGNIWLSFNSADRNKIDEETYLILKNAAGSHFPIMEKARYKVIAIENEAPDYIKTDRRKLGTISLDPDASNLFAGTTNTETLPPTNLMKATQIEVEEANEDANILSEKTTGKLSARFIGRTYNDDGTVKNELFTHYFPITNFSYLDLSDVDVGSTLKLMWETPLNEVANMFQRFTNAGFDLNVSSDANDLKYEMELTEDFLENKPEFDGKFFVKIETDVTIEEHIMLAAPSITQYNPIYSFSVGYISTQSQNPGLNGPYSPLDGATGQQSTWAGGDDSTGANVANNFPDGHFGTVGQDGTIFTSNMYNGSNNQIHFFAIGCRNTDDGNWTVASGDRTRNYWADYLDDAPGDQIFIDNARSAHWSPFKEGQSGYSNWYDNGKDVGYMSFGPKTGALGGDGESNLYAGKYYRPPGFDTSPELAASTSTDAANTFNRITFSTLGRSWENTDTKEQFKNLMKIDGCLIRFANDTSNDGEPHVYRIEGTNIEETRNSGDTPTRNYYNDDEPQDWSVQTRIFGPGHGPGAVYPANIPDTTAWNGDGTYDNSGNISNLNYYIYNDFTNANPSDLRNWSNGSFDSVIFEWDEVQSDNGSESQDEVREKGYFPMNSAFPISGSFASNATSIDYIPTWDGIEIGTPNQGSDNVTVKEGCPVCDSSEDYCYRMSLRITIKKVNPETGFVYPDSRGLDPTEWDPRGHVRHDGTTTFTFEVVEKTITAFELPSPIDGACWETEPKENVDLDIYYEASDAIPFRLQEGNATAFAPIKSSVIIKRDWGSGFTPINSSYLTSGGSSNPTYNPYVSNIYYGYNNDAQLTKPFIEIKSFQTESDDYSSQTPSLQNYSIGVEDRLSFVHPNGTITTSKVEGFVNLPDSENNPLAPVERITATISKNTTDYSAQGVDENRLINFNVSTDYLQGDPTDAVNGLQLISYSAFVNGEYDISSLRGVFLTNFGNIPDTNPPIPNIQLSYTDWMVEGVQYTVSMALPTGVYAIDELVFNYPIQLGWHNCWAFGNGVESDRVRDDYNAPQLDNGVKASSTFSGYGEENKSSGLIYSGIYNSTSEVNNLNEFNQAEKITKDLNPSYGSIQRLKTRDTDIVTFCEDKILKILANKDALFNADGNPQLTATNRVLGTAIPFVGDYGISKNPESLAVDQFRMYFTDKERGAVLRLSRDGLTPISNVGMKGWFRENIKDSKYLLGTFDIINSEYNLTIPRDYHENGSWFGKASNKPTLTVSFNESAKGWTSFKSFQPENGLSLNDKYILSKNNASNTPKNYVMYQGTGYNNFGALDPDNKVYSTLTVLFNDIPGSMKSFHTINYEGSQAKIVEHTNFGTVIDDGGNNVNNTSDGEFYNLNSKKGWSVESFETSLQSGGVPEFINKEGKWFNYIKGLETSLSNIDTREFTVQGIGKPIDVPMYISITPLNNPINEGDTPIWIIHSVNIPAGTTLQATILGPNSTVTIDDLEFGTTWMSGTSGNDIESGWLDQNTIFMSIPITGGDALSIGYPSTNSQTFLESYVTKINIPIQEGSGYVNVFEQSWLQYENNNNYGYITNDDGNYISINTGVGVNTGIRIKEDFLTEGPEYIECVVAATDSNGVVTNLPGSIITITDTSLSPPTYELKVQQDPND